MGRMTTRRLSREQRRERIAELRRLVRRLLPDINRREVKWLVSRVLQEKLETGESLNAFMLRLWQEKYIRVPVSLEEFITGPDYLNLTIGPTGVYPKIMECLELIFGGPYSEVVLAGSIGWGKTTLGTLAVAYDLYRVSCLRDPAATFGMKPGSNLSFVNISADKKQAQGVFYTDLSNLIRSSWYFNEEFPFNKRLKSELRFPKNVRCFAVAASEQAALGVGVFCAFIDEVNFMDVVDRSKRSAPGGAGVYDQAEAVFNKLKVRMRSRMNLYGRLPGHLFACSSARYPGDFTERVIERARKEYESGVQHTLVFNFALWDTIPEGRISPNRFRVELGHEGRRTRVLTGTEDDVDEARVIEVPEDYREQFDRDPDEAVRDLAGRSVLSIRPFIGRRELIAKMFERGEQAGLKHPFTRQTVTLQEKDPDLERLVPENLHWIEVPKQDSTGAPIIENRKQVMEKKLLPVLYYAHVDLAKNGDAAGLAIVHSTGKVKIARFDAKLQNTVEEFKPFIRVDLVLRIVAPRNGEIDIPRVRGVLYQLNREFGMQFGKITFDSFGSLESVKTLKDESFNADVLSVDKDMAPYEMLKAAIYDERILCCHDPVLERELAQLERGLKKVDHPATHNGSKDLADALCGAVFNCEEAWRNGESMSPLFLMGVAEPPRHVTLSTQQVYAKVVEGVPLSGEEENIILFGNLEDLL
jgi:hypothetical protein